MIYFFTTLFFSLTFSLTSISTFACEIRHPDALSLYLSSREKNFVFYDSKSISSYIPGITISDCEKVHAQKKYLMIALGPENQEFTDRVGVFDFTNDYQDSGCTIKNSPFSIPRDFHSRKKELERRWKTLSSCLAMEIQETIAPYLDLPSPMELCEVKRLSPQKVQITGGLCFLRPFTESNINLTFIKKQTCLPHEDQALFKDFSFDLEGLLNFYIAKDFSGNSIDLTSLESLPFRLSITPLEKVIPLSDDLGGKAPQFPSHFEVFETHLGAPEIKKTANDLIHIKPFFWVDHFCSRLCASSGEEFCQSICEYTQPLFGKFDLFELSPSLSLTPTPKLLESWFDGGVIRPHFQGEISGYGKELKLSEFNPNTTYRLEALLTDPKEDFEEFKADYLSRINFPPSNPSGSLSQGIPEISPLPPLNPSLPLPGIRPISEIKFSTSLSTTFQLMIQNFSNSFSFRTWPPYIEKICSHNKCQTVSKKPYLKMGMDFKIISLDTDSQNFKLQILRLYRQSPFLSSYEKKDPLLPEIQCPFRKKE